MKKILFITSLSLFAFASCNTSASKNDVEETITNIDPKAKGGNSCLLGYAEKYDELLTKDMVAQASGTSADKITFEYQKNAQNSKYQDVTYSWKTGRKKTISGMEIPVNDYIKITGVESISLNQFQMSYKAVTAKEAKTIMETTNEAVDGKIDNEAVNERLKKLDEMGISKEEQKKMMESFTNSAQKMTEGFAPVENLGDTATWNAKTNTMYVFKNGAMFELVVDLTDVSTNSTVATQVSQQILDKCK